MAKKSYISQYPTGPVKLNYQEWGDSENPEILICVPGLTRNCRDFDFIAQALQADFRVICVDLAGRGKSEWVPAEEYTLKQHTKDLLALIEHIGAKKIHWLGTSLGGILGMVIAGLPNSPIQSLVLNDIGPVLEESAIQEIASSVQSEPIADTLADFLPMMQSLYTCWGDLPEEIWTHIIEHDQIQLTDGRIRRAYDPNLMHLFSTPIENDKLWKNWLAIECPIFLVRGEESTLLPKALYEGMIGSKTNIEGIVFECVGHAPSLMKPNEIGPVAGWLQKQIQSS